MKRRSLIFLGGIGIVGALALGGMLFSDFRHDLPEKPPVSAPVSEEPVVIPVPSPPPLPPAATLPLPLPKPLPEPDSVRLFRLLKEKEPETYKILMARTRDVMEGRKTLQEVQIETAPALQKIFMDYLPYASSEALVTFTRQFITLAVMLKNRSPEACRRYILGEEIQDIIAVIPSPPPPELVEGNIRVLLEILETTTPERHIPTADEVTLLFADLLTPSPHLSAEEIVLVMDPGDPRQDPDKICNAFIGFYQKILELPPDDANQILRYRFFHVAQEEKEGDLEGEYDLRLSTDRTKIVMSGYIGSGTARKFEQMLDDAPTVRDVYTNSERGGLVGEARAIRDLIRARKLTTRVTKDCVSACTIIFQGGVKRYLYPDGKIGFHRYTSPGFPPLDLPDEKKDLLSFGVPVAFVEKVFKVPTAEMWYPEKQELFDNKIITTLTPPPYR